MTHAAPVEGGAASTIAKGDAARAREQALADARRNALEQAISTITDVSVDTSAVQQVLTSADAWTASYRVLSVSETPTEVTARVEVEIDVPRLRKRIATRDPSTRAKGFRWGGLTSNACGTVDATRIEDTLRAYGVVGDEGASTLELVADCKDRGAVTHTHVRAAKVTLEAKLSGAQTLTRKVEAQGFAEDPGEASAIALDRALADMADELAVEARGDLELRVEQPWPAARVRRLEVTLREAVIGVDAAELSGIEADGTAIVRVQGRLDAKTLGERLQNLKFPDFSLVGLRLDATHALRVRMQ